MPTTALIQLLFAANATACTFRRDPFLRPFIFCMVTWLRMAVRHNTYKHTRQQCLRWKGHMVGDFVGTYLAFYVANADPGVSVTIRYKSEL
jgi:hypothetical protein